MSKIIGLLGLAGSGKSTASEIIQNEFNYQHISFADSLKEAVSIIFGWEYDLLLGKTSESRIWREQVDSWWSKRLNIPNLTPRWVLQNFGTEVCRNYFHEDIWIASVERKLETNSNNIVIDDCRFPNEFIALRNMKTTFIEIQKGEKPIWYPTALTTLQGDNAIDLMEIHYPEIHVSEWGWINQKVDYIIHNDSDIAALRYNIKKLL